eukprot:gene7259-8646_t
MGGLLGGQRRLGNNSERLLEATGWAAHGGCYSSKESEAQYILENFTQIAKAAGKDGEALAALPPPTPVGEEPFNPFLVPQAPQMETEAASLAEKERQDEVFGGVRAAADSRGDLMDQIRNGAALRKASERKTSTATGPEMSADVQGGLMDMLAQAGEAVQGKTEYDQAFNAAHQSVTAMRLYHNRRALQAVAQNHTSQLHMLEAALQGAAMSTDCIYSAARGHEVSVELPDTKQVAGEGDADCPVIGAPVCVQHEAHFGWDEAQGKYVYHTTGRKDFEIENLGPAWLALLGQLDSHIAQVTGAPLQGRVCG